MAQSAALPLQPAPTLPGSGEAHHLPVLQQVDGPPGTALEAVSDAVAEAIHELRNTLTGLTFQLAEANDLASTAGQREIIELSQGSVGTAASILRRLEFQLRGGPLADWAPVDLNQILLEVAKTTRFRWWRPPGDSRQPIKLQLDLHEVPPVRGLARDLTRLFTNLVLNACEALTEGGEVVLQSRYNGQQVTVMVSDNGPGITDEVCRCLFTRNFSTKEGDNRGLGLSIVQTIIREHGGHLLLDSAPGRGTTFCLIFPDARATCQALEKATRTPLASPCCSEMQPAPGPG